MKHVKLAVFDLDGTLAEIGKPVLADSVQKLKEIEEKGVTIAICSGKPTYYLCGLMRQVGLKCPILIGEDGGVIQFGVDLPLRQFYILPHSEEAKQSISFIRDSFAKLMPDLWYQPNLVGLTPFPKRKEEFDIINTFVKEHENDLKEIDVYRFVDCFDFMPQQISKGAGLAYLGELLHILPEEMVVFGDSSNDYPMFAYAGCAVGIHLKERERADWNFDTIGEALEWLAERI